LIHTNWNTHNLALNNAINQAKSNIHPLTVWFIHDSKPGHINQLKGLEERISSYCDVCTHWVDASNKLNWLDILLKKTTNINTPQATHSSTFPDIVIAAGHATHKALLFYAYLYKAYCIAIMKPSLPLYFFDAVICPKHDKIKESKRVLNTYGAINTVRPSSKAIEKKASLILIGGPSKHFKWQEETLLKQIKLICNQNNTQWLLSNSPRTPNSFLQKLKKMDIPNLNAFHYKDNNLESLHTLMLGCAVTWITPDSVSMVYESLTAGTPTYIFSIPPKNTKKPSRVALSISDLINQKHVISFQNWELHANIKPNKLDLWEADRAAKWLLNQYFTTHLCKNDV
jgi:mitochondrial fission protein ELM1